MIRSGLIAAAALTLGGCNLVYSERPLFGPDDAVGAQPLRPGLWAQDKDDCRFDERKARRSWPSCADWFLVRPDAIVGEEGGKRVSYPYVLAGGDPRVGQMRWNADADEPAYVFGGVRPLRLDGRGRIVAFSSWVAQCGPMDAAAKAAGPTKGTLKPLPGLTMDADGANCRPVDRAAVRAAATASEAWTDHPGRAHWVRDREE